MSIFDSLFGRSPYEGESIEVAKPTLRAKPLRADPFPQGYNLEKWMADPNLAEQAQKLFSEGLFQNILAVLYNGIPRGYPGRGIAVNDTMAHIELGRYQGYMDCLDLLNSLAVVSKPSTEVPLDWNAEPEP